MDKETDVSPSKLHVAQKIDLAPSRQSLKARNVQESLRNGIETLKRLDQREKEIEEINKQNFDENITKLTGTIDGMGELINNSVEMNEKLRERSSQFVENSIQKTLNEVLTDNRLSLFENECELIENTIMRIHRNCFQFENKFDTKDILNQVYELQLLTRKRGNLLLNAPSAELPKESFYHSYLNGKNQLYNLAGNNVKLTEALDEICKLLDEFLAKEADLDTKEHTDGMSLRTALATPKEMEENLAEEQQTAEKTRSSVKSRLIPKVKKSRHGETFLPIDEPLKERWLIKGMIGKGGYGEIYLASDLREPEEVAVKAEPKKRKGKLAKRMILEQKTLQRLQGRPHVPRMLASGQIGHLNFIVMQLLSVNLGDLKKASPCRRLSQTTVARIMLQGVGALRDIHSAFFLHRDVKPANMCFGITPNSRHILMLVDFGLVRKFKSADGQLLPPRRKAGFRGTSRYVSVRVHDRLEQGPADDLVSLAYSGLELLVGDLPWKYTYRTEDIKESKENLQSADPSSMLNIVPEPMHDFCRAIFSLGFSEEPNYHAIQGLIIDMTAGRRLSDPYDWEENYREVVEGTTPTESVRSENG